MNIRICTFLVALFLVGCSSFPDKLQLKDTSKLVNYEDASSKFQYVRGKTIRWGGAIAKVDNKLDSTVFEMVYYPLNKRGRPISGDESMGRFRINVKGFMDPMIYQVGRLMTFTGELNGLETGLVGEYEYEFPKANVKAFHLWKEDQRNLNRGINAWPNQFWFGGPFNHWQNPFFFRRNMFFYGPRLNRGNGINLTGRNSAKNFSKPVNTNRTKR